MGGGGGPISPHSHYAIQLVIGAPSGLRVQFGRLGKWQPCAAALVPSRVTHTIDVTECEWSAVLFIEPETPEGKALAARLQGAPEVLDADAISVGAKRLDRAWRIEQSYERSKPYALTWCERSPGPRHGSPPTRACSRQSSTFARGWTKPSCYPRSPG